MPLTFKRYLASADINFKALDIDKDELENVYGTRISIEINNLAIPHAVCAKLTAAFHQMMLEHTGLLENVSSSVLEVEIKTKEEIAVEKRQQATEYYEKQKAKFISGTEQVQYESLTDQIVEDQKTIAYSWNKLSGLKLEVVNELLIADVWPVLDPKDFAADA